MSPPLLGLSFCLYKVLSEKMRFGLKINLLILNASSAFWEVVLVPPSALERALSKDSGA
jgi:hypothetical protein